jgi:hypothetical protein
MPEKYRLRVVSLVSGAVDTTLADRSDVFIEVNDPASGTTVLQIRDDGVSISGNLTVNGTAYVAEGVAENDLSNVSDEDFFAKADQAGLAAKDLTNVVDADFLAKADQAGLAKKDLTNILDADFLAKGEQAGLADVDFANVANSDFLAKAQSSGVLPEQLYWGYQDFAAGGITSVNVTLTANQNGTNAFFDTTKLTGRAFIANADDLNKYVYTGTTQLFSSKVKVNAYSGAAITLSAVPHASYNCRVYYEILCQQPAANYQLPIAILSPTGADNIVNSLTTDNIAEGANNLYFTNTRGIGATLTGFASTPGSVTNTDSILSALQKIVGNVAALVTGVSSVFGRGGAVTAQSGDYTASQVTNTPAGTISDTNVQNAVNTIASRTAYFISAGQVNYVDLSRGNDSTGDGTEAKPFKTLAGLLASSPNLGTKQVIYLKGVGNTGGFSVTMPNTSTIYIVLDEKAELNSNLVMPVGCGGIYIIGGSITNNVINNSASSLYCLNNLKISGAITNNSSGYCEISNLNDGDAAAVSNTGSALFVVRYAKTLASANNSGAGTLSLFNIGSCLTPPAKSDGNLFVDTIQNIVQNASQQSVVSSGSNAGLLGINNCNFLQLFPSASKGKIHQTNTNASHTTILGSNYGLNRTGSTLNGVVQYSSQGYVLAGLLSQRPAAYTSASQHYIDETGKIYYSDGLNWSQVGATSAVWGNITGTLSNQTDLQTALNAKENTVAAGTSSQYYRGDKTFQTLNKAAVGLSNVDNTSDADKPISNATQIALNAKQNSLGISPSTSIAHQVVKIKSDGSGYDTGTNIPAYTTTQRDALSNVPTNHIIFNSTSKTFQRYTGSAWEDAGIPYTNSYVGTFTSANFAGGTLTIAAATHGLGASSNLFIRVLNASFVDVTSGVLISINDTTGDISIQVTIGLEFSGKVLVYKASNTPYLAEIPDNAITNAKLAQMPDATVKANRSGATANAVDYPCVQTATVNSVVARDANANFAGNRVVQKYLSQATSASGTLTLTNTAPETIILTGTATGYSVVLPDATTLEYLTSGLLLNRFTIINSSSQSVSVKNSAGTVLYTHAAGAILDLACTSTATAAGVWLKTNPSVITNTITYTSNATYNPSANLLYAIIEMVGGGGAGGTAPTTNSLQRSCSSGGGGGGYLKAYLTPVNIGTTKTVVVGQGGLGATPSPTAATDSTFGGNMLVAGAGPTGAIGVAGPNTTSSSGAGGTNSYTLPASQIILNVNGGRSGNSFCSSTPVFFAGAGGSSVLGSGAPSGMSNNDYSAFDGTGFGGGGRGSVNGLSTSARSGGSGSNGVVIITEYIRS